MEIGDEVDSGDWHAHAALLCIAVHSSRRADRRTGGNKAGHPEGAERPRGPELEWPPAHEGITVSEWFWPPRLRFATAQGDNIPSYASARPPLTLPS